MDWPTTVSERVRRRYYGLMTSWPEPAHATDLLKLRQKPNAFAFIRSVLIVHAHPNFSALYCA